MAKQKQRQLAAVHLNENNSPSCPDLELLVEDGWVVVKKQKINILIPPLPVDKQATTVNEGPSQLQPSAKQTTNMESDYPIDPCLQMDPVDEREKYRPLVPKKGFRTARRSPRPIATFAKLQREVHRMGLENPDQVEYFRCHNTLGGPSSSRVSKKPSNFHGGCTVLNHRMRASNIERKLQIAGGLSPWLESLGLDQFVKIFEGKGVNKFQLVNLTMKKLKDMGADAVGPRRKLMHAIECLCQPHCFGAL